jgi:AcrR family transcriptional regulator
MAQMPAFDQEGAAMYVVESIHPDRSGQRSRRENRAAILSVARGLFARHGLAGVTFDDIARETGLTRRTIYNHFANVGDLFAAAMRVAIDQLSQDRPAAPSQLLSAAALERHLADLLAFFGSPRFVEVHTALVRHGCNYPSLARALHSQILEPLHVALASWLADRRGRHAADTHRIARDTVTLALGLAESVRLIGRANEDPARHAAPLAAAVAHMLVHPRPRAFGRVA